MCRQALSWMTRLFTLVSLTSTYAATRAIKAQVGPLTIMWYSMVPNSRKFFNFQLKQSVSCFFNPSARCESFLPTKSVNLIVWDLERNQSLSFYQIPFNLRQVSRLSNWSESSPKHGCHCDVNIHWSDRANCELGMWIWLQCRWFREPYKQIVLHIWSLYKSCLNGDARLLCPSGCITLSSLVSG